MRNLSLAWVILLLVTCKLTESNIVKNHPRKYINAKKPSDLKLYRFTGNKYKMTNSLIVARCFKSREVW
jgi:hypothetical protein